MAAATLQDVRDAIQSGYMGKYDPMKVYVTGFEASQTHPNLCIVAVQSRKMMAFYVQKP
jgi:hypothetical protein